MRDWAVGILILCVSFAGTAFVVGQKNLLWRSKTPSTVRGIPWIDPKHPCGPTCVAIAASLNGKPISLDDAVTAAKPDPLGRTSMTDLIAACEGIGLAAVGVRLDIYSIAKLRVPVIVHTTEEHFMVIVANRGGSMMAIDPPKDPAAVDIETLRAHFSGNAILVARGRDELNEALTSIGLAIASNK